MKRSFLFLLLAACAHPVQYRLRMPQTNPERPGCRAIFVGGAMYAVHPEGTHVLRIDPETLKSDPASPTIWSGFHSFDVDASGTWIILTAADGYTLNGPRGRQVVVSPNDHAAIHWTADHAVAWSPGRTLSFGPKRGAEPVTIPAERVRLLGVDYGRNRVWAERDGRIVSVAPGDRDWAAGVLEHRDPDLPSEDQEISKIAAISFGRDTFAFVRGGFLHAGRIAGTSLRILDRIQMPEPVERIEFSARDSDVLLVWTTSLWVWDLETGDSLQIREATWPACVDPARKLILTIRGSQVLAQSWDGSTRRESGLDPK